MKKALLLFATFLIGIATYAQRTGSPSWTAILSDDPETYRTELLSSTENSIQVHVKVPGFYATNVETPKGGAKVISLPKAISTAHAGEPNLPMTAIPVLIGDQARMDIRVTEARYLDFEGIEVAPSKGDFPRSIDPATVPYTYGECYEQDAFFPSNNIGLYEPYIIRDFRGQNMVVYPFAYNPISKTLRVYYDMTVELFKVDDQGINVMKTRKGNNIAMDPDFKSVYQRHFINYEASMSRYTPVDEEGDLLIICHDNFLSAMNAFVQWKKTRGINTIIVGTSTSGSSYTAIKNYIQSQYNANNNLTHVLLVGDVAQIPGYSYTGGGSSYSGLGDNSYGQIVGNDLYNDLFIGRFSASNATQVTTQVQKVITYERDLTTSATWLQKGMGVSTTESNGGHYNEDDYEHIENLRTDLLNYGYTTVYQEYYGVSGYSSTTQQISTRINSGVGIITYCNHGSETAWQSHSPYYSTSYVNALTNNNQLPFIFSVACLNGKYDYSSDCFAEAWMRATNNGTPTGAIGTLMSYISQPWIPPMWAEDEFIDILVESYSSNIKRSWGGCAINSLMSIFDHYGTSESAAVGTYQAWVLYGDPTLMLRTKTPQAMTVNHAGTISIGQNTYTVQVPNGNGTLATITNSDHEIMGSAKVSNGVANIVLEDAPMEIEDLTLCVFGYNKVTYLGTISVVGGAQYGITLGSCEHGTFDVTPNPAYVGQLVTLTPHPDAGYCLSEWHVTTNAKSQDVPVINNQFVMPEGEVTVTANFVVGHNITLATVENGSIAADPTTALAGTTITLTATPNSGYTLGDWLVYKTGDLSTTITVTDNQFVMPDYDVTVMAFFVLPTGGDITIGSGSSTSADLPSNVWYGYTTSQQIYTKAELGDAGTITAISFNYNGNATSGARNIDIYMTHTTSSTLSNWVAQSATNKVYSGTQTFTSSGWYTITLDTPFEYNGNNNLLITVDDNTGSYVGSNGRAFYVYATGTTRAIYYRSDTNNQSATNPSSSYTVSTSSNNNQLIITKATSSPASLTVTPESLSGFSYNEGQGPSEALTFTVLGYVAEDIVITAPTDYEICATQNGTYSGTLTLPNTSAGVVTTHVFVRLKSGLAMGDYNNETLTVSCGEVSKTVTLNGSVINASHWTMEPGQYADNMTLLGVIFLDSVEQSSTELEVGAFCGNEVRGTGKASYCPPVNRYILPLVVYGNLNDLITFKLYDPASEQEFDSDQELAITDDGYGSITNPVALNFYTSAPPQTPLSATVTADPSTTCAGESVTLTATATDGTGNYTYNWTPADLIADGQGTATATTEALTQTTTFTCTVSDGNETLEATVTVTVNQPPVANAGEDKTIAYNTSTTLVATSAGSGATYSWAPTNKINGNYNKRAVTTKALTETTTFTVTVTKNGCVATDEVTVFVEEPPMTINMGQGWTWFSSYLEFDANDLASIKSQIGATNMSSALIKSQTQYTQYLNGNWYGELSVLENEKMYMVNLEQELTLSISSAMANPENHPITLSEGWNWIGFLSPTSMSLTNALSNLSPSPNDVIKGQSAYAIYSGTAWLGSLVNLDPGKGYMYQNNGTTTPSFTYPSSGKATMVETTTEPHWKNDVHQYAHNLCMMVSVEGLALQEGSHEIGAFVNGECRGSARIQTVEGFDTPMAFLTVSGIEGEEVSFRVYDANAKEEMPSGIAERIRFASDALYGSLAQPYLLHLNANGLSNLHQQVTLFPNPSHIGQDIHIEVPNRDQLLTIEVIDLLGCVLRAETTSDGILRGMDRSGIYTLKVTDREGNTYYGKIIIND